MQLFKDVVINLEKKIEQLNQERFDDGDLHLPKAKVTLLGQFSLIANPKVSAQLHIPATMDVDARIEAHDAIKKAFLVILKEKGLQYDEDSHLVWIPPGSTFETLH